MKNNITALKAIDKVQTSKEYQFDSAQYVVSRVFDGNKTIKQILLEKISENQLLLINCQW